MSPAIVLMKKTLLPIVLLLLATSAVPAQRDHLVNGISVSTSASIAENVSASPNLSTLSALLKAAGLTDTLTGAGPYTIFAPTNEAFGKLPAGVVDKLAQPAMKDTLNHVLSYHIIQGKISSRELIRMIRRSNGKATLKTLQGGEINAILAGDAVMLIDTKGNMANVTTSDISQSNGALYIIDTVMIPQP